MFPDHEQYIDNQQGKKTGDFADRLDNADMVSVEADDVVGKIVKKGTPEVKTAGRANSQYQQVEIHGLFDY